MVNKSYQYAGLVLGALAVALFVGFECGLFMVDLNGLFNGILQSMIGGFIAFALTVVLFNRLQKGGKH